MSRKSSSSRSNSTLRRTNLQMEHLEDRLQPTIGVLPSVDPTAALQTLFAPDATAQIVKTQHPATPGLDQQLFRFALDGQNSTQTVRFDVSANLANATTDVAIGLYDASGNLLAKADAFANGPNGAESLTTKLESGKVYVLGVFSDPNNPTPGGFSLSVFPGAQVSNPTISIDPGTGEVSVPVGTGEDAFNAPADVDFYRLKLTNGGASGQVTITPANADVQPFATVFYRSDAGSSWQPIASAGPSGGTTVLNITPPLAAGNLTDGDYLLAVAPKDFGTAAGGYAIAVSAQTLAPVPLDPTTAHDLFSPTPKTPGVGEVTQPGLVGGTTQVFRFRAQADGTATISATASFPLSLPILSVYDATGTQLLSTVSRAQNGQMKLNVPVTAGSDYLVRAASSSAVGTFDVTIDAPYTPTQIPMVNGSGSSGAVSVGPTAGAKYYRFDVAPGSDLLVLQVQPQNAGSAIASQISLLAPDGTVTMMKANAGATIYAPMKVAGNAGTYDLFVMGDNGDPVTVQVGQIQVPQFLTTANVPTGELDLTGKLDGSAQIVPGFGGHTAVQYYSLQGKGANTPTDFSATGGQPLFARYEESGGLLRLVDWALPNAQGTLSEATPVNHLEAIAAFNIGFASNQLMQVHVSIPNPVGVGVGTVPDLTVAPPSFQSVLKIDKVQLESGFQQQLWQTILPNNLDYNKSTNITFTPNTANGPLQVKFSVYQVTAQGLVFLYGQQNAPGQPLVFNTPNSAAISGATLLFRVEATGANHLGDGIYSIDMTTGTTDPKPYDLNYTDAWVFAGTSPATGVKSAALGLIPASEPVVDIVQNQFGHGEATGTFTDPTLTPSNGSYGSIPTAGQIDVYRFWAINPGPVAVKTVADPGSTVNTDIRVYRAQYDASGKLYLANLQGPIVPALGVAGNAVNANLDWFPADRSSIDAQSFVTDFANTYKYDVKNGAPDPFGTGGGMYFVVVRNEGGSLGKYRVEVDTAPNTLVGDASNNVTAFPTSGGTVQLNIPTLKPFQVNTNQANTVRQNDVLYYPIQMPNFHDGTLTVDAVNPLLDLNSPKFGNSWQFALYDAAGNALATIRTRAVVGHTVAAFQVPDGLQTVYLRVQAPTITNFSPNVTISTAIQALSPAQPPAKASLIPNINFLTLPALGTDPFGNAVKTDAHDGRLHDAVTKPTDLKVYQFQAPTGEVTINVAPDTAGDVTLRWAAYVNDTLVAWGLGDGKDQTFALPALRQYAQPKDYDYAPNNYQTVILRVESLGNALTTGKFTLSVQSDAVRPVRDIHLSDKPTGKPSDPANLVIDPALALRKADLTISPIKGTATAQSPYLGQPTAAKMNGLDWTYLSVPVQATGPATVNASVSGVFAGRNIQYDLYDATGNFLASGTAAINNAGAAAFLVPQAVPGHSYYLRVGVGQIPGALVTLTASAPLPIFKPGGFQAPPAYIDNFTSQSLQSITPAPDGSFALQIQGSTVAPVWIGKGGHAQFTATPVTAPTNFTIALYRARFDQVDETTTDYALTLVDYQDSPAANGGYSIQADVDPGLYVVRVVGSFQFALSGQVPAYPLEEIVLDGPVQGDNLSTTRPTDSEKIQTSLIESFRTTYYHVVAPPGTLGLLTAKAIAKSPLTSDPIGGSATLAIWNKQAGAGAFSSYPVPGALGAVANPAGAQISGNYNTAQPGQDFYVSLTRKALAGDISVSTTFHVPQSGTPDLVVTDFQLLPNNGETRVQVTVQNRGYATAGDTTARLTIVDSNNHTITADLNEFALGQFTTTTHIYDYDTPIGIADTFEYQTDYISGQPHTGPGNIEELSETNNTSNALNNNKPFALSQFDAQAPKIDIPDPLDSNGFSVDGNADPNTWGRYLATSPGPIADIHAKVQDDDLYQLLYKVPSGSGIQQDELLLISSLAPTQKDTLLYKNFNFGGLGPTDVNHLNQVQAWVKDSFGLTSSHVIKQLQVEPKPQWATDISYDKNTRQYTLTMNKALVAYGDPNDPTQPITVKDLTGFDFPGVGDLQNQFLVEATSTVPATLNPTLGPITAPLAAHVKILAFSQSVLDQTFDGSAQPTDHLEISTNMKVDDLTLQPSALDLTFRLKDLDLLNYQTPKIPLLSYGIPGVASLDIALQFSIDVFMNAAVTMVFDPNLLNDPLANAIPLGVGKPTFITPSVKLGAEVSGDAEILGFDLASVGGGINFTLNVTVAVDPQGQTSVAVADIPNHLGYDISGDLGVEFKAKVLGFTVWSFEPDPIHIDFGGNLPADITDPLKSALAQVQAPTSTSGSDPVGPAQVEASPNIVIDPVTGFGLLARVVDADPNNSRGNLVFSTRANANSGWVDQMVSAQPDSLSNVALAFTGDAPGAAVVTYFAAAPNPNGTFAQRSLNDTLDAQDVRYRYFDGTTLQPEVALTSDGLYNSEQVMAFNNSGAGLAAWVHNTNPTPAMNGLDAASGDIQVAVWNARTHTFGPVVSLTSDPQNALVTDTKPSVFADDNGTLYVVWLRTVNGVQTPTFSAFTNGAWSAPAALGITGLPAGGRFNQLAIGSGAPGRIDVMVAYTSTNADGSASPVLYDRPAPAITSADPTSLAKFAAPAAVESVATGGMFSHLRTMPDRLHGGMVTYWQQSNGIHNDVYADRFDAASGWATPTRLTSNPNLTYDPSVAIDTDGTFQTVYENAPLVATPTGTPQLPSNGPADVAFIAPTSGIGSSSVKLAPEWAFAKALYFPYADAAASGTVVQGQATIINRGTLAGDVQIQAYLGDPASGGQKVGAPRTIHLAPGQTFDLSQQFVVQPGQATYAVQLTPMNSVSETNPTDDVSLATLTGEADVAVTSVSLFEPNDAKAGQANPVTVTVANLSDQPVPAFDVTLYQGDPLLGVVVGTQHVSGLGPKQSIQLVQLWTVPAAGGDFTLTAVADSAKMLTEVTRGNNIGYANTSVKAEPQVTQVTAKVLNFTGVNNVMVTAQIANPGGVGLASVPVQLFQALDDGKLQLVGTKTVVLPAGGSAMVGFLTAGLAGTNRYQIVVDPAQSVADHDRSDNTRETTLVIAGLPDLTPGAPVLLETQTPTQGQKLTVRSVIQNTGIAGAGAVLVEVFAGDPRNGGFSVGKITIDHLAALSSTTVDIPIDTSKLFYVTRLVVVVDRLEKILETSDLNNRAEIKVLFNPKDTVAPTSAVSLLPAITLTPDFTVSWSGVDGPVGAASGIATYDVFVSVDGGAFKPWLVGTAATSATFHGQEGHQYAFYTVATDNAGNRQTANASAAVVTRVPTAAAQIRGVIFNDTNGNGQQDVGELPLAGITVFLDLNNNGKRDLNEPSTTTDATGAYAFTGLPAGKYSVLQETPMGFVQTTPGGQQQMEPPADHFLLDTQAGEHYAWADQIPSTPEVIDIGYDFRPIGTFANQITAAEEQVAMQALQEWSNATQGRLRFFRDTTSPMANIINIGVGDLAALHPTFAPPGSTLGLGGANTATVNGKHILTDGFAWLNAIKSWATGASQPAGSTDFFTVIEHELGHALGLGDLPGPINPASPNIMDDFYTGPLAGLSPIDVSDIRAVYPTAPSIPNAPPVGMVMLAPGQVVTGVNFGDRKLPPLLVPPLFMPPVVVGANGQLNLGTLSDNGSSGPWKVDVNWGDNTAPTTFNTTTTGAISGTHQFAAPGLYLVSVKVTDEFGAVGFLELLLPVTGIGQ